MIYGTDKPRKGKPANGYPSFCWHCSKQLQWIKGGNVAFQIVRDPGGAEHRVHGTCVDDAVGDGVVHVQPANVAVADALMAVFGMRRVTE